MEIRKENGFLIDENNNRMTIAKWSSEEKARELLLALEDCKDCIDCSDCSDCSRCLDCSDCSDCSRCLGCSRCSDCSDCSRCLGCLDCSDCSDCSGCSGCLDCSDCSRCSRCSGCSGCSDCSDCSRCSGCSGCSGYSHLDDEKDQRDVQEAPGMPPTPVIEDIHKKVYEAVSAPGALDMSNWHTCETTHCRAGWVVHLAGDAGKKLEAKTSTAFAAQQIYKASGYLINPGKFYVKNDAALEDMRQLAEG